MRKLATAIMAICLATAMTWSIDRLKVEEKETIERTLSFQDSAKSREVQVDNIFGSISVEGYSGGVVRLTAHKTIKTRTKDKLTKARREVTLDITEDGNTIDLYVNGPFRCQNRKQSWRGHRDPGYQVHYDFILKVPHGTNLYLKTVAGGDISVFNVEGDFDIQNVNGKIEMTDMAGSGDVHTVNGGIAVRFNKNPAADCSFKTINGDINIEFREGLSADFRLKTFNGDAYSDFPVDYLPTRAATQERKHGKFVYKSDRFRGIRINKGGPEIKMDTLNGDLLINKRKQGG